MRRGGVSYPPSPLQMIKLCMVTFKCWRCGKIAQERLQPRALVYDPLIAICGECAFNLMPTWFSETWIASHTEEES